MDLLEQICPCLARTLKNWQNKHKNTPYGPTLEVEE